MSARERAEQALDESSPNPTVALAILRASRRLGWSLLALADAVERPAERLAHPPVLVEARPDDT